MDQKKLSELTDEELLIEAKKMKSNAITNGVLVGFFVGIIVYSIVNSSVGLFTLIPLFLAYKLINNSKYNQQELKDLLKERNLK